MINVIVATHGPLADALLASGRMVYGELPYISTVTLDEQAGIEGFKQDFARALECPDSRPTAYWCCAICKAERRGTSPACTPSLRRQRPRRRAGGSEFPDAAAV
ncbi:Uncharacterised protein [Raoultella terrigena]|uniref:EIIAB-Man n=1 Tax=Raoultella terrigena TaxID=577 RepID=A0A4U9DD10_RAOTE|nr:Uncharacterised protein [Raoultella terrigena]